MTIRYECLGIPVTVEEKADALYQRARRNSSQTVAVPVKRLNWTSLGEAVDVASQIEDIHGLKATIEGVPVKQIAPRVRAFIEYFKQIYGAQEVKAYRPRSILHARDHETSLKSDLGRVLETLWDREMWRQARDIAFGA